MAATNGLSAAGSRQLRLPSLYFPTRMPGTIHAYPVRADTTVSEVAESRIETT